MIMIEQKVQISVANWWRSRRLKYNKGLVIAGFIAFLLYAILGEIVIAPHEDFEVTIFVIAFQGIGYIAMMVIANVLYTMGWLSDIFFNKNNSQNFRETLFFVGYWFSLALPISFITGIMIWTAIKY